MPGLKHLYLFLLFPIIMACDGPDYSSLAEMYSKNSEALLGCQICYVNYLGKICVVPCGVMEYCLYPSYSAQFETYEDFLRNFFNYSTSFDINNLTYHRRGRPKLPKLPGNKECLDMLDVVDDGVWRPKPGLSPDIIERLVLHMFYKGYYVRFDDYSCRYTFYKSVPPYLPIPQLNK